MAFVGTVNCFYGLFASVVLAPFVLDVGGGLLSISTRRATSFSFRASCVQPQERVRTRTFPRHMLRITRLLSPLPIRLSAGSSVSWLSGACVLPVRGMLHQAQHGDIGHDIRAREKV